MSILDMFTQMSGHRTCNLQALLRLGIEVPMGIFLQSEKFVFFFKELSFNYMHALYSADYILS